MSKGGVIPGSGSYFLADPGAAIGKVAAFHPVR
jgi:hypothetical protein